MSLVAYEYYSGGAIGDVSSTCITTFLTTEVVSRGLLHRGIGRGVGEYMRVNIHNLFDALSALVDIAFLLSKMVFRGHVAAFAAAAVGVRMLRLSRFVLPLNSWYKIACRRLGVERAEPLDSNHLPFEIFRRCVSASVHPKRCGSGFQYQLFEPAVCRALIALPPDLTVFIQRFVYLKD